MIRHFFLALVMAALAMPGVALAQAWPTRQPIKLIIPFPAGSSVDAVGRPVFNRSARISVRSSCSRIGPAPAARLAWRRFKVGPRWLHLPGKLLGPNHRPDNLR